MTNKLHVANLPFDTTVEAVRSHFATCGGVADVELGSGRGGDPRGVARVTMTSGAYAAAAIDKLDRTAFEGRVLRVSEASNHAGRPPPPTVKILQQFRERANMTYELDCSGKPLTIRIFSLDDKEWRIEARANDAEGATVVKASAATRREALEMVLRQWNEQAPIGTAIDGDGLFRAMGDIRAI